LYYSGVLRLWQLLTLRNRAVVLMYHRVLSEDEQRRTGSHPGIVVGQDTFDRQMALLRRRFVVLSMDQFARHLAERIPLPHSSCVITFDDGWRDNLTAALPVLRQHGLSATVFLPVRFIGHRRVFWRESLTHLLVDALSHARTDAALRARITTVLAAEGLAHLLDAEGDPRPAVIDAIAGLPRERAAHLLTEIEAITGRSVDPSTTPDTFMDWAEVHEMAGAGVTFGGHGADHVPLADVPVQTAEAEIREARDTMRARATGAALAFAYPNGSYNGEVVRLVKSAGYRLAFTTRPGRIQADDDPFTLKRVNIHEAMTRTPPMFLARVLGVL
jgi:peptidoglycan/xylan/chitin deacetylase (PgdA/CDA1 family)